MSSRMMAIDYTGSADITMPLIYTLRTSQNFPAVQLAWWAQCQEQPSPPQAHPLLQRDPSEEVGPSRE